MKTLVRSASLLAVTLTFGLFAVTTAAFAVRLLPWLFAPQVPLGVSLPFARALLGRALETAMVIGMPVGFALAMARFVDRGEARALHALGMTPARMMVSLCLPAAVLGAAYPLSGVSRHDSPGHFASELLARGRRSCADVRTPRAAEVPLIGVTWLCFPGHAPLATGRVPGIGHAAWFTARGISPSSDLQRFDLEGLTVNLTQSGRSLRLRAPSARIAGLPAWGRPETLGATARAALAAASAVVLALGAAHQVAAAGISSRLLASGGTSAATVVTLSLVSWVDGKGPGTIPPALYAACPAVGLVCLWILGVASRAVRDRGRAPWAFAGAALLGGQGGDRKRPAKR